MFGRIQSTFLLAAAILILMMFFAPIAALNLPDGATYSVFTTKVMKGEEFLTWNYVSMILNVVVALLSLVSIFVMAGRVKNMRSGLLLQFRFCVINILLQVGMIVMTLYQLMTFTSEGGEWSLAYAFIFPVAALMFTILAIRGILNDMTKIKSFDRIR